MKTLRSTMNQNWDALAVEKIQPRWCCGEYPYLFRGESRDVNTRLYSRVLNILLSQNDGRDFSPTGAMSASTNLILREFQNSMIRSNTIHCTSELPSLSATSALTDAASLATSAELSSRPSSARRAVSPVVVHPPSTVDQH